MTTRRNLLLALGVGVLARAGPLRSQPAGSAVRRVGVLGSSTRAKDDVTLVSFYDEMRQLGWVEGRNLVYEHAQADDQEEMLPRLAADLVARKPEVIAAASSAALAARRATRTIPIIFASVSDPVRLGLVESLPRPGGNATGIATNFDSLAPKHLELLLQVQPRAKRIGVLGEPGGSAKDVRVALTPQLVARELDLVLAEAANLAELESAVGRLADQRVDALLAASALTFNLRARFIELASARRIPVVGTSAPMAQAGALFTYGPTLAARHRRQAQLVDQVLRGASPAEMPVEQPTQFELVLNLKTAKLLGITIPQAVLLRADEVIA